MENHKKLVIILSRFPYPLDKGDKLRAFHQIKYLALYYDIHLIALTEKKILDSEFEAVNSLCKTIRIFQMHWFEKIVNSILSIFKSHPVQVGYFFSDRLLNLIHETIHQIQPDLIYGQLARTALYFNQLPFKKLIDFQDAFSINYERIQKQSSGFKKWFYRREGKLMQKFEQKMLSWFDACTIISDFDKSQLNNSSQKLHVISNGVDASYFSSHHTEPKQFDILFLGNLSYLPNKQAAEYLMEEIVPLLRKSIPNITIHLAGADPGSLLKYKSNYVSVSGWIPDIRVAYESARIFVAPLFSGAGLQNKLLEAMCMDIPCVTTSVANASLKAEPNTHFLLANNAQEFTNQVIVLLKNPAQREEISKQARLFVEQHYSWNAENEKLNQLITDLIQ